MDIRLKRKDQQAWLVDRHAPNFGLPNKIDLPVPKGGYYIEMGYQKTSVRITIRRETGQYSPESVSVHDGNYLLWDGDKYSEYTPEMFDSTFEPANTAAMKPFGLNDLSIIVNENPNLFDQNSANAEVWAKAFCDRFQGHDQWKINEWFANAMQAMADHVNRMSDAKPVDPIDTKCRKCDGCGQIANDEDGTPWTFWKNLPVQSAGAVVAGIVKQMDCPQCHGTGEFAPAKGEGHE